MGTYKAYGNRVCFDEYFDLRATCRNGTDAIKAADLLNKARNLNDAQRKYTAAARMIAKAESIEGFAWVETVR